MKETDVTEISVIFDTYQKSHEEVLKLEVSISVAESELEEMKKLKIDDETEKAKNQ